MKTGKQISSWKDKLAAYTVYRSKLSLDLRILPHRLSWTPGFNRNEVSLCPGQEYIV